ncbi:MAG: RNA methyltransferase [Salinisphaeraceae bacterium]|nr:RNA methyltransferase [Salinisphaeraceae bacterium]
MQALDNIRIVLVETSHPGNIGAAARAAKTMGIQSLHMVKPRFFPHEDATAFASGAVDVLERAVLHDSLEAAVSDCRMVVGTTARRRTVNAPILLPDEAASNLVAAGEKQPVALVFGRERTGLTNSELDICQQLIEIPANPEYSSLNLAAAVQVLSYECRRAALNTSSEVSEQCSEPRDPTASAEQLEGLYGHLETVLIGTGFLDADNPRYLMRRLRRLFGRAGLDERELNILRGILSSVQNPHPPRAK